MSDRLFHAVANDSLKEDVKSIIFSKVLPLVKELNHVYGLKVYGGSTNNGYAGLMMCNEEGFAIAKVFFHDDAFCYHAPYQQKSRGSDNFDRQTFRSTKLSHDERAAVLPGIVLRLSPTVERFGSRSV